MEFFIFFVIVYLFFLFFSICYLFYSFFLWVTIEQAKGYLARAAGVDVEEAFGLMRRYARAHQRSLSQVAAAVARDDVPLADLIGAGAS